MPGNRLFIIKKTLSLVLLTFFCFEDIHTDDLFSIVFNHCLTESVFYDQHKNFAIKKKLKVIIKITINNGEKYIFSINTPLTNDMSLLILAGAH